jgi:hypothetical protein
MTSATTIAGLSDSISTSSRPSTCGYRPIEVALVAERKWLSRFEQLAEKALCFLSHIWNLSFYFVESAQAVPR